ncbi:hypothetical protein Xish_00788 [Xenorhabdus ishibashii]|uniref:Uncharacterized protein n=1 Tax=Xenorhabdus ishibashii TaxID=1034471 RepID=A0A2D0KDY8_9GAMM|nr:hypothetical protein Xish_00788 [Xenorhabdus ishibashii]
MILYVEDFIELISYSIEYKLLRSHSNALL